MDNLAEKPSERLPLTSEVLAPQEDSDSTAAATQNSAIPLLLPDRGLNSRKQCKMNRKTNVCSVSCTCLSSHVAH